MKTAHYPILAAIGCVLFAVYHFLSGDVADGIKSLNHAMGFIGLHWMIGEQNPKEAKDASPTDAPASGKAA